jgi:hypothetical protein
MIVSIIRGEIFMMSSSLLTLGQLCSMTSSMHIMIFEIRQPTMPSMKIWLIIFRFTWETTP